MELWPQAASQRDPGDEGSVAEDIRTPSTPPAMFMLECTSDLPEDQIPTRIRLGSLTIFTMAASPTLLTIVGGVVDVCGGTSQSLRELGASIGSSQAGFTAMAAECTLAKVVLQTLCEFLNDSNLPQHIAQQDLHSCFEVLVENISTTVVEVNVELGRIRRYSVEGDASLSQKLVPVLQDSFADAMISLKENRGMLSLVLDCMRCGTLESAKVYFPDASSIGQLPLEKLAEPTTLGPRVVIGLIKQSSKPNIQALAKKIQSKQSKLLKFDSRSLKKLHEGIDSADYGMVYKALVDKTDPNLPLKNSNLVPMHRALAAAEKAHSHDDDATFRDMVAIVTALVIAGANLQAPDEDGRTPLIRAVNGEMTDALITLMLEYGAKVNATDKQRNTALHYAAMQRPSRSLHNVDVIRTLLVFGADQNIRNVRGRAPLYKAIMYEHLDRVEELLNYGADLEIADTNGWTAIFGAVNQGNAGLVRLLCQRGAVVDRRDNNGQTPLHHAISQSKLPVTEALVGAGADVNTISKGETPLCRATAKSSEPLIAFLLAHNADVTVPSPGYAGALPIHIASMNQDEKIFQMLIDAGSPIDAEDEEGRTPLRWARDGGRKSQTNLLLRMGARMSVSDNEADE